MASQRTLRSSVFLAGLLTLSGAASAQVEAWVARYTGPVDAAEATVETIF